MGADRMDLYGWEAQHEAAQARKELAAALLRIKELEQVEAAYKIALQQLNEIHGRASDLERELAALKAGGAS